MLSRCLKLVSHKSLYCRNLYRFSEFGPIPTKLSHLNFAEYTKVYRHQLRTDEYEYIIEDEAKRLTFTVPDDATLADLKDTIKTKSPDIQSVEIYSMDLSELANITRLSDLGTEGHYLVVNGKELCKVRSLDQTESEIFDQQYKSREETCVNIGLPFIEQQIILNYLKRVDNLNRQTLGKNLFADDHAHSHEGKIDKNVLIQNLLDGVINDKNQQISNEESVIEYYNTEKQKLEELQAQHELIEAKAHSLTKWKMSLGLFALLGQFSFVGIGTYVIYSWDIIEPLAYFLNLAGSIVLSTMYFRIHNDYSNIGFLKHMKEKEMKKLYAKYNFPIEEMRRLENMVETIERKIKSNILVNL